MRVPPKVLVCVRARITGICVYMDGAECWKSEPRLPKGRENVRIPGKGASREKKRERKKRKRKREKERERERCERTRIDRRIYTWRQEELERQGELYAIGQPAHFLSDAGRTRDGKW